MPSSVGSGTLTDATAAASNPASATDPIPLVFCATSSSSSLWVATLAKSCQSGSGSRGPPNSRSSAIFRFYRKPGIERSGPLQSPSENPISVTVGSTLANAAWLQAKMPRVVRSSVVP